MQSQADKFLEVLTIIGPAGYYARTPKEKEIMSLLEKKQLIHKKPGTKRVYILNSEKEPNFIDIEVFKDLLSKEFKKAQTVMRPFVPINELRTEMANSGIKYELFNSYLTILYDNNELELEKSFTADEGLKSGLNYKNKKFFSYITQIN